MDIAFDRHQPYNGLPMLPPTKDIESKDVLKKLVSASRSLAELKQKGRELPNQSILINSLVLIEAKDSSEIERVFTTHEDMYRADIDEARASPEAKEVQRYRQALKTGLQSVKKRPLSTNTFIEIMQCIKETSQGIRTGDGTKIQSTTSTEIIYTPPVGESRLRDLLRNLEIYLNDSSDRVDPLIKMAVAHYQFEAIHPFADGNGRTGRILNILYLCSQGLLNAPVLFLSRYFITNSKGYYYGLQSVTEDQDWTGWLLYMLDAVEVTAQNTIARINDILSAMEFFAETMKSQSEKIYSTDLLYALFENPFIQISDIQKRMPGMKSRQSIAKRLEALENIGLITSFRDGKNKIFLNTPFYQALKAS
jgi:Fic family protein